MHDNSISIVTGINPGKIHILNHCKHVALVIMTIIQYSYIACHEE